MTTTRRERTASRADLDTLSPDDRRARNTAAIAVLESFLQEDEIEQRETWEYLQHALDEDRPSNQKLFG